MGAVDHCVTGSEVEVEQKASETRHSHSQHVPLREGVEVWVSLVPSRVSMHLAFLDTYSQTTL